jgi:chromosome segregation ATPase
MPQIEGEIACLRADGDAGAAAIIKLEVHLAEALAEIKGRRAHLAELARDRDDLTDELEVARAELVSLRFTLAETTRASNASQELLVERAAAWERAAHRADDHAGVLQAEIKALQGARDYAESAASERAATIEALHVEIKLLQNAYTSAQSTALERAATIEALHAEIKVLQSTRARAEAAEAEHATAVEALRSEIKVLRNAVAHVEERGRRSEDAAAVLLADLAVVRKELAAARYVGRAALASLTTSALVAAVPHSSWFALLLHRFGFRTKDPLLSVPKARASVSTT